MDTDTAQLLRQLVDVTPNAALATLHKGEPAVSMVPWVWVPERGAWLIHVSALATHTRDMQAHPCVGLMVCDVPRPEVPPQALARVSFQAEASFLDKRDALDYAAAQARYVQRFPEAEMMFDLGDFSLVALQPLSARLIAGFGRAYSLVGLDLTAWLSPSA